jgi:FixJ family two-component response regulator
MTTFPPIRHVHIVEDDEVVRLTLSRSLAELGYRVRVFADGRAFLGELSRLAEGCVLLDLRMPRLSGLEVQSALRAAGCRMPVIFLTGHGDVPSSVLAMKRGAQDFLLKPVREPALLQALADGFATLDATRLRDDEDRALRARYATLTPREREVLGHAAAGLRSWEIAERLGIRLQTAKVHRMRAMAKLKVASNTQLSEIWHRLEPHPAPTVLAPASRDDEASLRAG